MGQEDRSPKRHDPATKVAAENIKDAEVTGYDEMTVVFAALDSGQIDAVSVGLCRWRTTT